MSSRAFKPKPGQIDYTHVRRAPVVNCVVQHGELILLVKRSEKLNFYPGYWNGISGFLDDERTPIQKARDELQEELGIQSADILSMSEGAVFEQDEPRYDKIWIVHPILATVSTNVVRLDWEAQEYRWLTPLEAYSLELLPGFDRVLATFQPEADQPLADFQPL